jgi:hypothetical protein
MIAGLFGGGDEAVASPPSGEVSFTSVPSLFPDFSPQTHDYVVRCNDGPVTVEGHTSGGWEAAIRNEPFRSGDFSEVVPLSSGRAFTITVREVGHPDVFRYHVRCLPNDFPTYTFTRDGPASPKYFAANDTNRFFERRYGIIFNDHGVPIWWIRAPIQNTKVLPGGNILWAERSSSSPVKWEIHRLDGSLVRTLDTVGQPPDSHDLQLLGNGDYLAGANVKQSHVDTSTYGGSSDADVANTELQQVSASGQLVWDWKSQDQISLAETGRWWTWAINHPVPEGYDILHWNSIEPAGNSVIASFRHLDAVYKINKSTGNVVWKLGGTSTSKSLEVRDDPRAYTFGAQHDARLLSDGSLTVFDNRTNLGRKKPRAVRYRIDQEMGTATLLQSITDPEVPASHCCGSVRRLPNRDWLISWGGGGPIGGYKPDGERTFLLTLDTVDRHFSMRAEPVPAGVLTAQDLREGMRAMAHSAVGTQSPSQG